VNGTVCLVKCSVRCNCREDIAHMITAITLTSANLGALLLRLVESVDSDVGGGGSSRHDDCSDCDSNNNGFQELHSCSVEDEERSLCG
jgi:hypothetical protein